MKLTVGIVISIFCLFGCVKSNKKYGNNKSKTIFNTSNNQNIDSLDIFLKVERGAFHYDSFILKDTILTFSPSLESFSSKDDNYNHTSEQRISKDDRNKLIKYVLDNGIFDLNDVYTSDATCSSALIVTFRLDGQTKKVISDDFKINCPDLLRYIEREMIRLHGKNLKRVLLPG